MKKLKHISLPLILCFTVLLNVSCSEDNQETGSERTVAVKAMVVGTSNEQISKTYTGSVEGEKQAIIYAKLSEAVERVLVSEGQQIKADDVLLTLDRYGPTSRYNQSLSLSRNSEKNYKKMEYLYKEGAVSESEYDAAKTDYEVNKAAFEAVERLVEIHSPIAGVVTSLHVSPGDLVLLGQKLATIATTDRLRVEFGVGSEEIGSFEIGSEITVSTDMAVQDAEGEVSAIAGSADPMTRTFEVEAVFGNRAGIYRPGMFVRIKHIQERLESVIAVPRAAVLTLDGKETVYVVEGGLAKKRLVTLGPDLVGHVVVESGLTAGDKLVTLGQEYLDDGMRVNITTLENH